MTNQPMRHESGHARPAKTCDHDPNDRCPDLTCFPCEAIYAKPAEPGPHAFIGAGVSSFCEVCGETEQHYVHQPAEPDAEEVWTCGKCKATFPAGGHCPNCSYFAHPSAECEHTYSLGFCAACGEMMWDTDDGTPPKFKLLPADVSEGRDKLVEDFAILTHELQSTIGAVEAVLEKWTSRNFNDCPISEVRAALLPQEEETG